MTENQLKKVISLMGLFEDYPSWTKTKRGILKHVLHYMESGTHEYFTSNRRIHGGYVGDCYIEPKNHNRNGTLKKYRGKKLMVMCVAHGSYNVRYYIVAVIEGKKNDTGR
jgi:hypothetical protein